MPLADTALLSRLRAEAPGAAAQAQAIGAPLCYGMTAWWFSDPTACFAAVLDDLRRAEKRIWLAVPAIVPGVMWETVLTVLRQKAARGLDVRVVYDGRRSRLPLHYVNQLSSMRIRSRAMYRGRPLRALIVDGNLCYTGDLDIRDSRIGLRSRRGAYRTGVLRMQGTAAEPLCARFLSYFPDAPAECTPPDAGAYGYASFFQDAPAVLPGLIRRAEHSVVLMAPRLSGQVRGAMRLAAASGVAVRAVVGRPPLREVPGIRLAPFPGRIRGPVCCADGQTAVLVTGRDGVWLHGRGVAAQIESDLGALFDALPDGAYSRWKGRCSAWSRGFPGR